MAKKVESVAARVGLIVITQLVCSSWLGSFAPPFYVLAAPPIKVAGLETPPKIGPMHELRAVSAARISAQRLLD